MGALPRSTCSSGARNGVNAAQTISAALALGSQDRTLPRSTCSRGARNGANAVQTTSAKLLALGSPD